MKRKVNIIPFILILLVFYLLARFENESSSDINKNDIREIVWTQLSKEEKKEIIGNWKAGTVEKVIAQKDNKKFSLDDSSLDGKEVYLITFKSKYEPYIGNVQKLVNIESKIIVGTAFRN